MTMRIVERWDADADCVLHTGDCRALLRAVPDASVRLVVTSPPYNLGKAYERRLALDDYVAQQGEIIAECVRVLAADGSICWQVGNWVERGAIVPLDVPLFPLFAAHGLRLRNRVVWHFEHGLHASRRFSGRYEVVLWFTRDGDYCFDLDAVRVPQKYPQKKHYKGPRRGELSGNPLGKNPGDVWVIPNVKANHVEKTDHPCQFPVELVERLVLALTRPGDWVLDPFMGVGSTAVAALMHGRRALGADVMPAYVATARERVQRGVAGTLRVRPRERSVYDPDRRVAAVPPRTVRLRRSS